MTAEQREGMSPLLNRIASALIQATPEWWTKANMRVEIKHHPNGATGMEHSIWSEQYPRDVVTATDEIFQGTRDLQLYCQRVEQPWSALVLTVEQAGDNWRFDIRFEYPD